METGLASMRANQIVDHSDVTEQTILDYFESFGFSSSLKPEEKKQFVSIALAYRLNPFKREIYAIPYNTKNYKGEWERKLSIITGYEVYLKRAERCADLKEAL